MNPKGVAVDAYGGKYSLPNDKSTFEDFINYIVGHGDDAISKARVGKTDEGIPLEEVNPDVLKQIHPDNNGAY